MACFLGLPRQQLLTLPPLFAHPLSLPCRGGGRAHQGGPVSGGGICVPSHDGGGLHPEQHQLCGEMPGCLGLLLSYPV